MELVLGHYSIEVTKLYTENEHDRIEPGPKEIYLHSIQAAGEAIGKYLTSEKKDFKICMEALKEASNTLDDWERKIVLRCLKEKARAI